MNQPSKSIRQYAALFGLGADDPVALAFAERIFRINQRPEGQREFLKWAIWDTLGDLQALPKTRVA